jgi:hypothetical protein
MRIPVWPGTRISIWEKQDPDAVQVTMKVWVVKNVRVRRALSMPGWMILFVRYDDVRKRKEKR